MDTETKYTVEVYDNLTGEHYERECTAEEIAQYEQWEIAKNETPVINDVIGF